MWLVEPNMNAVLTEPIAGHRLSATDCRSSDADHYIMGIALVSECFIGVITLMIFVLRYPFPMKIRFFCLALLPDFD